MSIQLSNMVDTKATIEGTARNAHLGAVLLTEDRTPIYIDGLRSWDDTGLDGQQIKVEGMLRRRKLAPDPVVEDDGSVSHGVEGDNYVFENASWQTV